MFMSQHLADCLQRYALRERDRRGESMARHVDRGIERQTGMSGNLSQRHVQRLVVTFERKDPFSYKVQVLITIADHFSYGEQFYPKLRTRFLTLVDNPPIPVTIRMNICVGQLCNVRMAQTHKSAEDEGVPVNTCFVVG